jgi:hypothetical protein
MLVSPGTINVPPLGVLPRNTVDFAFVMTTVKVLSPPALTLVGFALILQVGPAGLGVAAEPPSCAIGVH